MVSFYRSPIDEACRNRHQDIFFYLWSEMKGTVSTKSISKTLKIAIENNMECVVYHLFAIEQYSIPRYNNEFDL